MVLRGRPYMTSDDVCPSSSDFFSAPLGMKSDLGEPSLTLPFEVMYGQPLSIITSLQYFTKEMHKLTKIDLIRLRVFTKKNLHLV